MMRRLIVVLISLAALCAVVGRAAGAAEGDGAVILEKAGAAGGLVVVAGCERPALLAGLRRSDAFTVVGLGTEPPEIGKARSYLQARGLCGPVTVVRWDGKTLPFTQNLVNVLVLPAGSAGAVAEEERMRVLRPGGVVLEGKGGEWQKTMKAWPEALDDWPQYFHSATGNAVSEDTVVGPPRGVQWWAGPFSDRSHNWVNSTASMVTAGGRLFYLRDEGPIAVMGQGVNNMNWASRKGGNRKDLPESWSLVARDAFNGKLLWTQPLSGFGQFQFEAIGPQPTSWNIWSAPLSLNRRAVADGLTVYATLSYRGGLTALDAATGEAKWEYSPKGSVDEVVLDGEAGRLYLRVRSEIPKKLDYPFSHTRRDRGFARTYGPVEWEEYVLKQKPEKVVCVDTATGAERWSHEAPHVAVETLCAGFGKVCFFDYEKLVCLDAETGEPAWTHPFDLTKATSAKKVDGKQKRGHYSLSRSGGVGQLLLWDGKAFFLGARVADRGGFCLDLADGSQLWHEKRVGPSGGFGHPTGVRIIDGVIWNDHPSGYNAKTGAGIGDLAPRPYSGTHSRCHRGVATEKYIMGIAFGIEFYDIAEKKLVSDDRWLRSTCALGYLPANGLLYHTPDPCACWLGARIRGYHAFAPEAPALDYDKVDGAARLEKGPAYGAAAQAAVAGGEGGDWPTYRHDALRSGGASSAVGAELKVLWTADLGSPYDVAGHNVVSGLTPPVAAGGRVYVTRKDASEVVCLDQTTGEVAWRYLPGSYVDSPPTIVGGLCVFGCADGYVYCLRAEDGALAWRFRAAPADVLVLREGRPASKWPVWGSVLVKDGAVYCTAGESSFVDGGIQVLKLDPATGRVLAHARAEGPRYEHYTQNPFYEVTKNKWGRLQRNQEGYHPRYADVEGARADILVSDGVDIRMGATRITPDLEISSILREQVAGTAPKRRWLRPLHLFIDDTYWHRAGWHYSDTYMGGANAAGAAKAGKILVFDERFCYGAQWEWEPGGRYPNHVIGQGTRINCDPVGAENEHGHGFGAFRKEKPAWQAQVPLIVRGMVVAPLAGADGRGLFFAGPVERKETDADPLAPHLGRAPGQVWVLSATDGKELGSRVDLAAQPVFDGMAAAGGKLLLSLTDGTVVCLGSRP
jgi:outer membrane protein assembly factor BamB